MRYQGIISRWNDDKGFGFVSPKFGGQPVFVHVRGFSGRQQRPYVGTEISYELGSDAKGRCCAVNVCYLGDKSGKFEFHIGIVPIMFSISFVIYLGILVWLGQIPIVITVGYLLLSLLTFGAYAMDKDAAENQRWRIPEKNLYLLGLAGGWPGAVFAQQLLRHKSSKRKFQAIFWLTVILNCGGLFWLLSSDGVSVRLLLEEMV